MVSGTMERGAKDGPHPSGADDAGSETGGALPERLLGRHAVNATAMAERSAAWLRLRSWA